MEKELSKRIIDEILSYFYAYDILEIRIGLEYTEEGLYMEFQGITDVPPTNLAMLADFLNTPRDPSMEIYYQELLGLPSHGEEIYRLIGNMIDDVEIMYDQPVLNIKLFRRI
ncbi:hypothetical protein A5844_000584 [Enterococcus sp. 10A9_DIV0425]|uniref:Uncharacterized protein n=1 Tax=Candidatus Enterococcus wittei TaxID=1987383 RepID=A0A2C9XQ95_9ENTE|nr:hypothetical protein [Enterococcus sp. 10A9_DIV0425]OTP12351.1 hypothetical protein A5844_000584 [Enterococcus sp. 10A9_DIV0425]